MKPEEATGKWPAILSALGVDRGRLRNRHGPCPICEGRDRWRFDDKDGRGTWFCSHCGAGDGFKFVMVWRRLTFPEALKAVGEVVGACDSSPVRPKRSSDASRAAMNRLWAAASPLEPGCAAAKYLERRLRKRVGVRDVRGIACMDYVEEGVRTRWPGMLARVRDAEGRPVNIHRTYLTNDGLKAPVPSPRRVMEGALPEGCAIRLADPAEELGIAEGIETAWAASILHGVPCWAAISENRLAAWQPPPITRRVLVFSDNDHSFAGQAAAFALAKRLRAAKLDVEVRLPAICGTDWADELAALPEPESQIL